jgi:hypothetical protein
MLSARATDDVLELFDLLMVTDLMSKAERESRDEKAAPVSEGVSLRGQARRRGEGAAWR